MKYKQVREILQTIKGIIDIAEKYEDTELPLVNALLWEHVLKVLGVGHDWSEDVQFYEVFVDFELGIIDEDRFIERVEGLKK